MDNPARSKPFDGTGMAVTPWSQRSASQKTLAWAIAIIVLSGLGCFVRGSPLIDPLPQIWLIEGFTIGGFIGLIFICTVAASPPKYLYFFIPFFCGLAFAADAQTAVEIYAFSNFTPQKSQTVGSILGPWQGGGGRSGGRCIGIQVQPFPGSRTVGIRTDSDVCYSAKWSKPDKKGCFLIDVETGRNAIRRAYTPINSYFSRDSWLPCPN